MEKKLLKYKGKPMVRCKDEIYYGSMSDKFVIFLKILSYKKVGDLDVAENVSIQLMSTDESLPATKRVIKKSEKVGLYNAMDIGAVWLERALRDAAKQ